MEEEIRQKYCPVCKTWKKVNPDPKESDFYTAGVWTNQQGKSKQQWGSRCKPCDRAIKREQYRQGKEWKHRKAYLRARSRALLRVRDLVPELYDMVLEEECEKEDIPYHPRYSPYERRSVKVTRNEQN